ncbi:MAG: hypothetical protein EOO59_18895, partial [Hymenobacter sp.]
MLFRSLYRPWRAVRLALLAVALPSLAVAQTTTSAKPAPLPLKFGQPDPSDFEAKNFVADSGAAAVVLCDYGNSQFSSTAGNLVITTERTT